MKGSCCKWRPSDGGETHGQVEPAKALVTVRAGRLRDASMDRLHVDFRAAPVRVGPITNHDTGPFGWRLFSDGALLRGGVLNNVILIGKCRRREDDDSCSGKQELGEHQDLPSDMLHINVDRKHTRLVTGFPDLPVS
jgi:hypothetical protein